jgi:hypothetical protein
VIPGNREHVAMTIAALAALHDLAVTLPVSLSQPLRDDKI